MHTQQGAVVGHLRGRCDNCPSQAHCLSHGMNEEELTFFSRMIKHRRPLQRGEQVFMMGDTFNGVVMVHSGSVKSYVTTIDGEQQIIGFHMPGDMLGIDGFGTAEHRYSAEALETTSVCELSFRSYEYLAGRIPMLQRQLLNIISRQMVAEQQMLLMLGKMSAEQRVAKFLLDMSTRMMARGMSGRVVNLTMSRNDMANYLGLALETVSRLLTRLQSMGVLAVHGREIQILDAAWLHAIVDNTADSYSPAVADIA